jgi:hypothetical protein
MNRLSKRQIGRAGAPLWAQRIAGMRGELRLNQANVREKIRCLGHDSIALGSTALSSQEGDATSSLAGWPATPTATSSCSVRDGKPDFRWQE